MSVPELIPDNIVSDIFELRLPSRLIADNKTAFPILLKNKCGNNTYTIMLEAGEKEIWKYRKLEVELKGSVDIESLKYRGEVKLMPIPDEPGYYKMCQIKLYKVNERKERRVPYRRAIEITDPIQVDAVLINISASGAKIECSEKIEGDSLSMKFTLLKKNITLHAKIVEQSYNKEQGKYIIRCYFVSIDKKVKKIISRAVKEITLMAKRRLQGENKK
ncbi:MAG: PilZ domain-containing protein [Candidatus Cellulosilyticum pullistercoris]|uniref:PilZ domain-containing protein n=1 Tax=Candidatus Cellulosilyticum pullistercoris TaxID=2838521 RepID=A0A9E2KBB4_9FIRM|nr:PilZ domain-containing protein [Candidatus Cellulosilyticum pullistercoris]